MAKQVAGAGYGSSDRTVIYADDVLPAVKPAPKLALPPKATPVDALDTISRPTAKPVASVPRRLSSKPRRVGGKR